MLLLACDSILTELALLSCLLQARLSPGARMHENKRASIATLLMPIRLCISIPVEWVSFSFSLSRKLHRLAPGSL